MTTDTVKLGRYLMQYIFESEWVGEMDKTYDILYIFRFTYT